MKSNDDTDEIKLMLDGEEIELESFAVLRHQEKVVNHHTGETEKPLELIVAAETPDE